MTKEKSFITLTPGQILEIFDVLTKFKIYQLPFHIISIFLTFKRSKIPYLKLVVSHCNKLSFCQCAILSIVIFHLVISSACHFINFSFNSVFKRSKKSQPYIGGESFHQLVILLICHFVNGTAHFKNVTIVWIPTFILTKRHLVVKVIIYIQILFIISTPVLIRHLWQLKAVVFIYWYLICVILLSFGQLVISSTCHFFDLLKRYKIPDFT